MTVPAAAHAAFRLAAGELGMCSASRLFVREMGVDGDEAIHALQDRLGREYPVLDTVAREWLAGRRPVPFVLGPTIDALAGIRRLLVVGYEAEAFDALVPALRETAIHVLTHGPLPCDWERMLGNHGAAAQAVDLDGFQRLAGAHSAILTFVYGEPARILHASPTWQRVSGPDVRTQFRSLVACNLLPRPFQVFPRWLVQVQADEFTQVVTA